MFFCVYFNNMDVPKGKCIVRGTVLSPRWRNFTTKLNFSCCDVVQ